jgi:hypothetical protein
MGEGPILIVRGLHRSQKLVTTHVKHWELCQDSTKFFLKSILREFNFAHVEVPYPTDFEVFVNDLYIIPLNLENWALKRFLERTVGVFR